MMRNKPGRPSGAGRSAPRKAPADWDDRPVKPYKTGRAAPEYDFLDEEDFYGSAKPARAQAKTSRPAKKRGAALPFGDDGYPSVRAKGPARDYDPYDNRPLRKGSAYEVSSARKTRSGFDRSARRPMDEDFPARAARGYDEELPVRKRPRAQSLRPVERYGRDDFEEFDRPIRHSGRPARSRKKKPAGNALLYWAIAIVLALLIGFCVRTFGFELITVRGDAMRGTLAEGDIAVVKKAVYYTQKPARGDIVAVNSPEGKLIRRVVALPGETIEIKDGITYVNDEPLDEPYVYQKSEGDYPLTTIPDGGYFVMSDNRLNGDDSRSFGLLRNTRSLIVGKVDQIVWPLSDWGSIQ